MLGSAIVYSGLLIATAGLLLVATPLRALRVASRSQSAWVAARNGFVRLAEDAPRELVVGTVVMRPQQSSRIMAVPRVKRALERRQHSSRW